MSEGNFEAKVSAKRETSAGIFLTLQIQPDDYKSELATLRVGSALMIGWAEVVNTKVEPIETELVQDWAATPPSVANGKHEGLDSAAAKRERRPFASLPLSQQAAIRCAYVEDDVAFANFILERAYADGWTPKSTQGVKTEVLLRSLCGVQSRREFDTDPAAGARWEKLERDYQAYLTTQRYASVAR